MNMCVQSATLHTIYWCQLVCQWNRSLTWWVSNIERFYSGIDSNMPQLIFGLSACIYIILCVCVYHKPISTYLIRCAAKIASICLVVEKRGNGQLRLSKAYICIIQAPLLKSIKVSYYKITQCLKLARSTDWKLWNSVVAPLETLENFMIRLMRCWNPI